MRTGLRIAGTALASGAVVVTACGGGTPGTSGGGTSACDRYFDAVYVGCATPVPPASEIARLRARFERYCADALTLPGVSVTGSALDACSSLVATSGCHAVAQGACGFGPGALADGSTCVTNEQCMSDDCVADTTAIDGGIPACGRCVAGTRCGNVVCGPNTICAMNGTSGSCVPIAFGNAGAACDGWLARCNPGLVCDQTSHTCATPAAPGLPCNTSDDCAGSLACRVAVQGGSTCQPPGTAGAPCRSDSDCASELGCAETAHVCASLTWVGGGQACGPTTRCLVGSCVVATGSSGTCPVVIADGKPCANGGQAQTCDTFSQCFGTCQLAGTSGCR